jgi:hypothetical protein
LSPSSIFSENHFGGLSRSRIESVRTEATRKSQLACFSRCTRSAIFPPRRLPRLSPPSRTPMMLVHP